MKAYVYHRYGGPEVVQLEEVPTPTPEDDELLVRIHATTVTAGDWRARTLELPPGFGPLGRLALGLRGPRQPILGTELAGVVEAVGGGVTRFDPGDEVFAFTGAKMGCHAEHRTLAETAPVAHKPETLTFEEAASLSFGGTTALHFLGKANLQPGQRLLVIGASGDVGTSMVQLAKHQRVEVTGVTSTRNLDLVRDLGADHVIDYTQEDVTRSGETYDVIADTVGATPYKTYRDLLAEDGRFLAIAGGVPDLWASLWTRVAGRGGRRVIAGPAPERAEDLEELARLAEAGVLRPIIDRTYPFDQMVDAHAYVETRRKRGSVVVTVGPTS